MISPIQASKARLAALTAVSLLLLAVALPAQSPAPPPPAPAQPRPAPAAPAPRQPRFTILLDAAHGGDDNGGQIDASISEKTVTLALSVRLRSLLAARGFPVVTTREGNLTLDADARAQAANHAQSAACLILHATQTGSGVHLFTSAILPTQPTRFLAWKTAQSAYVTRSVRLAGVVNAAFQKGGDAPVAASLATATLPGLDSLACPAVVLELAPQRDSDGSVTAEVTDAAYQSQVAETVAGAILSWKSDWDSEHSSDHLPAHAVIQTPLAGEKP